MTESPTLPTLELVDTGSPFDEAVLMVDGREEETITIACTGARELAVALIHAVTIANLFVAQPLPPTDQHQTPYRAIDC